MLFACSEMIELMEELVGSYLTQVYLQHELESNDYDRFCHTTMYIQRLSGWFVSRICQTSKLDAIIAQHSCGSLARQTA